MSRLLLLSSLLGLLSLSAQAQQLLWEKGETRPNATSVAYLSLLPMAARQQVAVCGAFAFPGGTGCRAISRTYCQVYSLAGTLQREQLGRGLSNGEYSLNPALGSGGWWSGRGYQCPAGSTSTAQRPYVQRLTAAGDTLAGWWLGPLTPRSTVTAALVRGGRLLTAGMVLPVGQPGQNQLLTLTCSDTLGRIMWQRTYPRLVQALDYATNVVATPSGGYLLNGQANDYTRSGYDHYLVETDSGGQFRRQRLLRPLGPGFLTTTVYDQGCNLVALPGAGGYLICGRADSIVSGNIGPAKSIGYVVRLDTALNVVWTYRHPPALAGTGVTSNHAYRVRLLPNGTVGLLLTDVRQAGTPATYLVQLDLATGRRVAFYTLGSTTQSVVIPYDWQWVGDGTLLVCGKSQQPGNIYAQGYLARWDFRGTPLAAARPGATLAAGGVSLWAYPVPATDRATVQVSGLAHRRGRLELLDGLGRVVHAQAVAADGDQSVALTGLAAGLYVARLMADGRVRGSCKVVVMP